jgi:hypothetical protein
LNSRAIELFKSGRDIYWAVPVGERAEKLRKQQRSARDHEGKNRQWCCTIYSWYPA